MSTGDNPFMLACRREKAAHTPIWLMRQAGRYLPEYRAMRAKCSFLDMCKRPELAAEVTLMPVNRFGVDAAIVFADILLIVEPMGLSLAYHEGQGPAIDPPVRSGRDVDRLAETLPGKSLSYVFETIRQTCRVLDPDVPLIGFCGAPFTVASYMIEGGTSRHFTQAKSLMYRDPGAWQALMERIVRASAAYLNGQIDAGAQAIQIFDSWAGCLNEADYRAYALPHTKRLIDAIEARVPVIHFVAHGAALLRAMREAGGDIIGLDWRVKLADAWSAVGYDVGVQGNLDPVVLLADQPEIERQAKAILDQAAGRPGHIFNLGHGVLPDTPIENVQVLVDAVHTHGA